MSFSRNRFDLNALNRRSFMAGVAGLAGTAAFGRSAFAQDATAVAKTGVDPNKWNIDTINALAGTIQVDTAAGALQISKGFPTVEMTLSRTTTLMKTSSRNHGQSLVTKSTKTTMLSAMKIRSLVMWACQLQRRRRSGSSGLGYKVP